MGREAALIDAVASVVDGGSPDWARVESAARTPQERLILEQLRIVAGVAAVHGSQPLAPVDETVPTAPDVTATHGLPGGHRPLRIVSRSRDVWGHFELYECIGEGSYGKVYRAWDTRLQRQVAIKLLKVEPKQTGAAGDPLVLREAQAVASVVHENVVAIHSVEQHDGLLGLCMEFIEGQTLEQHLKRAGSLGAREAALVGLELCRALAAVHAAGLIHCDVKARNVMRSNAGRLVLMDFGAGVFSEDKTRLRRAGTPLYLAPEVLEGGPPTIRSDIYSLGVLLFYAVTGTHPVQASSVEELHDAHFHDRRTHLYDHRPDLPERFVQVVDRALERDPARRFATAGAMRSALAESIDGVSAPAPAAAATPVEPQRPSALVGQTEVPRRHAWARGSVATLVAAGLLVAAGWFTYRWWSAPVAANANRVAVLPLRNLTGAPDWQIDAASEDLMGAVARIPGVFVTGWRSAARFSNRSDATIGQIARDLKAGWVVDGSIRRASMGGDFRMSLVLFDDDGNERWTATYARPDTGLAGVPSEAAAAIARHMGREAPAAPASRTPKLEARAEHSHARFLMRNAGGGNDLAALDHLERAIALDPDYATAHATLAACIVRLESVGAIARQTARDRATAAIERALALDETLAEAHSLLGDVSLAWDWDWSRAGVAYRRALELNPSLTEERARYAYFLAGQGLTRQALEEVRKAQDLDPLSPRLGDVGMLLLYDRQHDAAIRAFRERIDQEPNQAARRGSLARALAAAGRLDEAIQEMRLAITAAGGDGSTPAYDAELVRLFALRRAPETRGLLEALERQADDTQPNRLAQIGYIYIALGDLNRAFAYLDRAADGHASPLLWAAVDPRFDGVRHDPRYARLVARLKIPNNLTSPAR